MSEELIQRLRDLSRARHSDLTVAGEGADEIERLTAENAALAEANERFGMRQEWWNERMFDLEQERDALRALVRRARAAFDLALYGTRGTAPEVKKTLDALDIAIDALGGEKTE